ncbi:hypothetical protein [Bombella saccharophila]|uniref:Uncharacterized protein n=1 Tax=Bombella saccharophila TaxID=2967338 RepID=A0ABT3W6I5_9PROT|nr:hypothetical protein [Bombella saccharophila]MCX5614393.1 hypothetical protein [Bombella saccharophila]
MRRKRPIFYKTSRKEVSVASTLGRMVVLLGLTFGFLLLVRFCSPVFHAVQYVAGTAWWQQLYTLLHIETALGREQLILLGIVLGAFVLALLIQLSGLWLLQKIRGR